MKLVPPSNYVLSDRSVKFLYLSFLTFVLAWFSFQILIAPLACDYFLPCSEVSSRIEIKVLSLYAYPLEFLAGLILSSAIITGIFFYSRRDVEKIYSIDLDNFYVGVFFYFLFFSLFFAKSLGYLNFGVLSSHADSLRRAFLVYIFFKIFSIRIDVSILISLVILISEIFVSNYFSYKSNFFYTYLIFCFSSYLAFYFKVSAPRRLLMTFLVGSVVIVIAASNTYQRVEINRHISLMEQQSIQKLILESENSETLNSEAIDAKIPKFRNTFLARFFSRYDGYGDGLIVFTQPSLFEKMGRDHEVLLENFWSFALLPASLRGLDKPEQIGVSFLRTLYGNEYGEIYKGSRSPGILSSIYLMRSKLTFFEAGALLGSFLSVLLPCAFFLIGPKIRLSVLLIVIGSIVPLRDSFADTFIDLVRMFVVICLTALVFRFFVYLKRLKGFRISGQR